jgi:hypothetical protein
LVRWFQSYLLILALFPLYVGAADRTLTGDCTGLPDVGTPPTHTTPYDLDGCTINSGDDITGIVQGAYSRWSTVALRAPSETLSVTYTDTHTYTGGQFVFLEDEVASNRLTIQHVVVTLDAKMWILANPTRVQIGGTNLGMTLIGNHPGLGQGKPCTGDLEACTFNDQYGLVEASLSGGVTPALLDFRVNASMTWGSALYVSGGNNGANGDSTANRFTQINIAGRYLSSGVNVNTGGHSVWVDPDRTVIMDPWLRATGWDGAHAETRGDGVKVGCYDSTRRESRTHPMINLQYVTNLTGGVTLEYGMPYANTFVPKYMGTSRAAPYLVRYKDWGFSGPNTITGLPGGIMSKSVFTGIMKNDPSPDFDLSSTARWLRFQQLPSAYGNGAQSQGISASCAVGNSTDNTTAGSNPYLWMPEASRDGVASKYTHSYFHVAFQAITPWVNPADSSTLSHFRAACESPDSTPAATPDLPDRCHHNTYYVPSGTSMPAGVPMHDNTTVTGPGIWYVIVIDPITTAPGGTVLNPVDNTITDTRVRGWVDVDSTATGTVIHNVDFSVNSTPRAIVLAGGNVTITDICVPSGSTITGAGTVTLDGGGALTLPYTFGSTLTDCTIVTDGVPNPPTDGRVD